MTSTWTAGIHGQAFISSNLTRSQSFMTDVLGLRLVKRFDEAPGALGGRLCLTEQLEDRRADIERVHALRPAPVPGTAAPTGPVAA
jgi:catechol 2,3-dioxygenase-like lactoylglutathione lyase family enzyme